MRLSPSLTLALPLAAALLLEADHAAASAGYCVASGETSTASGHRIAISVSPGETTLYDQLGWSGSPSSFAWVLPVKGPIDLGLSSDALFNTLESVTRAEVHPPPLGCPPPDCDAGGGGADGGTGGGAVIARDSVAPFEVVLLQSSDPTALYTWLAGHNYVIAADVKPVVDAYVAEGFNFLAVKLVPGAGIASMRPIRVTTQGPSFTLPLRLAAAGAPAVLPITLWIFGAGRYRPTNFPSLEVDPSNLLWDWGAMTSNYAALRQAALMGVNGQGWLVEMTEPFASTPFKDLLLGLAMSQPANSGYSGDLGGAVEGCQRDLDAFFSSTIPSDKLWVTRLHGDLERTALNADLTLSLAANQAVVPRVVTVQPGHVVGAPPACPCSQSSSSSGSGNGSSGSGSGSGDGAGQGGSANSGAANGSGGMGGGGAPGSPGGCGCIVVGDLTAEGRESPSMGATASLLGLALALLRRTRSAHGPN